VLTCAMLCASYKGAEENLGSEYARFQKMPLLPREQFHLLVDGFMTNWHLQQQANGQEKAGVLASLGNTVQTAIGQSGTIGRVLSSTLGTLNVVTNLKNQLSNPAGMISSIGGSLLGGGLSRLFGRRLDNSDGFFEGITKKVNEASDNQKTIDSTLRTVDKGIGIIRSASSLFFGGRRLEESLKSFLGFSLAQLERHATSAKHLSANVPQEQQLAELSKTTDALRAGLRYLSTLEGAFDMGDLETHMFGPRLATPGLFHLIEESIVLNADGNVAVNTEPHTHRKDHINVVTDLHDYQTKIVPDSGINIAATP